MTTPSLKDVPIYFFFLLDYMHFCHYTSCFVLLEIWVLFIFCTLGWVGLHILCIESSRAIVGEGNGNPLQYSCLENPMDGEAWWAAVHGVVKSRTRLTSLSLFTFMHWRRKWQPTPVFLPGESQGWQSPVGCSLWGRTESDTTEAT